MQSNIRLGVNIDHVATIRNARGGTHPDPTQAAKLAETAGADGITAHLREDRRHISDQDLINLKKELTIPLNLEMAATNEMLKIALERSPNAVCIVPENREEITTEGGLDVVNSKNYLDRYVRELSHAGSRVSIFIDPEINQIDACAKIGAPVVELHVGQFCDDSKNKSFHYERILNAVERAKVLGIECHAGHGLTFDTVIPISQILYISEMNIGHFLIGESVFLGLEYAIKKMRSIINRARDEVV